MDDYDGLAYVKDRSNIMIAAGENEYTHYGFREMIAKRAVDIVQPDLTKSGGILECRKILALAEAWNLQIATHSLYFGPGIAATLHFSLSKPFPLALVGAMVRGKDDPVLLLDDAAAQLVFAPSASTIPVGCSAEGGSGLPKQLLEGLRRLVMFHREGDHDLLLADYPHALVRLQPLVNPFGLADLKLLLYPVDKSRIGHPLPPFPS